MLSVTYAECHYAECRYAECNGALENAHIALFLTHISSIFIRILAILVIININLNKKLLNRIFAF
jgi:hypothetical protein